MTKHFSLKKFVAASAIVMLTASCGSSSDDSPPPPVDTMAQQDATASASVAGFIAFIQAMIASLTQETNEPRNIGGITAPATETAEPTTI